MLKIAITVNPNKDHGLACTLRLLDILEEENNYKRIINSIKIDI